MCEIVVLSEFRGLLLLIMRFAAIMLSTKVLFLAFTRSCMQAFCNEQQQQRKHDYDKVMDKSQKCSQMHSSYGIA